MKPATIFALKHDGEPLSAEHGYPVRLIVPHLYLWKSVKWVRGFELTAQDEPGFWNRRLPHPRRSVERTTIRYGPVAQAFHPEPSDGQPVSFSENQNHTG